jgi:hypothetical protein
MGACRTWGPSGLLCLSVETYFRSTPQGEEGMAPPRTSRDSAHLALLPSSSVCLDLTRAHEHNPKSYALSQVEPQHKLSASLSLLTCKRTQAILRSDWLRWHRSMRGSPGWGCGMMHHRPTAPHCHVLVCNTSKHVSIDTE